MTIDLLKRPRRNRKNAAIRSLTQETHLLAQDLVAPFFIIQGEKNREPIQAMPGCDFLSIDQLIEEAEMLHIQGVPAIALFPRIDSPLKDDQGSEAWNENNLICKAIRLLKRHIPSLCVIADIALDPYTTHGHDGILKENEVDNDLTLHALAKQALSYARAGCDILAPSDMMDGRIRFIRQALDQEDLCHVLLLSYSVKYASSLYTPFRKTLQTTLSFGDKKSYQMNPANRKEAIREALLDQEEGADMLLVKPAIPFLDIIAQVKQSTHLPLGAFHVSGEYAMVMAAAQKGWLDPISVFYESLISIKRAGADFIFTYAVKQILDLLN